MRRQGAGLLLAPRSRAGAGRDAAARRAGHRPAQPAGLRGLRALRRLRARADVRRLRAVPDLPQRRARGCSAITAAGPTRSPRAVPQCGEAPLTRASPGTERLDGELRALVPRGPGVPHGLRRDRPAVRGLRPSWRRSRRRGPAVLVGTQMVAKGHDFPDVTLVVVADADIGLYMPDFRAAERTFQLLTQVAGRAGRAERPGRVLVQTWNPDVPCIRMALGRGRGGLLPGGAGRAGSASATRRSRSSSGW